MEPNKKYEQLIARFPDIKWGIEMEWENGTPGLYIKGNCDETGVSNLFLGTDLSVENGGGPKTKFSRLRLKVKGVGREFRTIRPWQQFPEREVKFALQCIRQYGWINKLCGLHFHTSGIPLTKEEYIQYVNLLQKQSAGIWEARANYCNFPDLLYSFMSSHHDAVPVLSIIQQGVTLPHAIKRRYNAFLGHLTTPTGALVDHFETRVFNMSTSFRGIHQSWVRIVNLLYKIKIEPTASDATV